MLENPFPNGRKLKEMQVEELPGVMLTSNLAIKRQWVHVSTANNAHTQENRMRLLSLGTS
jgi:hypothetical protein